jgi:hypothetical protein
MSNENWVACIDHREAVFKHIANGHVYKIKLSTFFFVRENPVLLLLRDVN